MTFDLGDKVSLYYPEYLGDAAPDSLTGIIISINDGVYRIRVLDASFRSASKIVYRVADKMKKIGTASIEELLTHSDPIIRDLGIVLQAKT